MPLELDANAYKVWLEFAGEVEKELVPGGAFEGMNDWGGYCPERLPAYALVPYDKPEKSIENED